MTIASISPAPTPPDTAREARLRDAALRLEAGFL